MGRPGDQKDWLNFNERHDLRGKRKTKIWAVERQDDVGGPLGYIKWYGAWRQYCFFPEIGTLFNPDCLEQIARATRLFTSEHKSK